MISNYIFHHLSQDSVDSTAEAQLPNVKKRMRENIVAAQLPPYCFTSLKTLLGTDITGEEPNGIPKWAIAKIITGTTVQKFSDIKRPLDDFPLVTIKVSSIFDELKRNALGTYTGNVEIAVYVDPTKNPSSKAWNILQRINSLLVSYTDISGYQQPKDLASGITEIQGLLNLMMFPISQPDANWDVQRCIYRAEAKIIV